MDDPSDWQHAPYRSPLGGLQRGRGLAVARLRERPEHARLVYECERASYLRSLLLLDSQRTTAQLPIHLLDCEPKVRLLAAQHTPLTDDAHGWLTELRDDPMEEEEIRSAAAERLSAS